LAGRLQHWRNSGGGTSVRKVSGSLRIQRRPLLARAAQIIARARERHPRPPAEPAQGQQHDDGEEQRTAQRAVESLFGGVMGTCSGRLAAR